MRRAVIDLGTHTALLLIVDTTGSRYAIIRNEHRIIGLGRDLESTGQIGHAALGLAVETFQEYRTIMSEEKVEAVRITATAVLRDAENADEIRRSLEAAAGHPVSLVTGDEEARLVYLAGQNAFPDSGPTLVIDIGGGSVEIVRGHGPAVEALHSLPLGAVRLTHRFLHSHPAPPSELTALNRHIGQTYRTQLKGLGPVEGLKVIGVAGTFTTASAMIQGLADYDPARITGSLISKDDAAAWLGRVALMTLEEQKAIPGLHPKRAGVIVAGFALISSFFDFFKVESITVSDQGLRFGVLLDWLTSDPR